MTALLARKLCLALFPAALALFSSTAGAQALAEADRAPASARAPDEGLPAYHHSAVSWDHSVTTQTVGVGDTPQSSNPTYQMGVVAKPRYYLHDDTPGGKHLSLRLDAGLYRELTNSDVTTRRGEWTFSDTDLALVYARRFYGPSSTDGMSLEVRPLTLTLPTSKASFASGRYVAPGVLLGVINQSPILRGKLGTDILSIWRLAVGYKRWFARATVPTSTSLARVRLAPDGRSLPSDALSGATLVRDQLEFSGRFRLDFDEAVAWTTDVAFAPAWKYELQDNVSLCGVVLTGCANVQVAGDDSRYLVQTQLSTELSVSVAKGFSVELGYANTANQIGPDGRRSSLFYGPDAVFFASISFTPHELATSPKQTAASRPPPPQL